MISVEWLIIARGASIDRETGAVTIFGISDGLTANSFPVVIQYLSLVTLLRRKGGDDEKAEARLRIVHNGKKLFEAPVPIEFQGKLAHHLVLGLNGVVFPSPGQAEFSLMLDSRTLGKYTIIVAGPPAAIDEDGGQEMAEDSAKRSTPERRKPAAKRRRKAAKRRA